MRALCANGGYFASGAYDEDLGAVNALDFGFLFEAGGEIERSEALEFVFLGSGGHGDVAGECECGGDWCKW